MVLLYLTGEKQFLNPGMEFMISCVCDTNNKTLKFKHKESFSILLF